MVSSATSFFSAPHPSSSAPVSEMYTVRIKAALRPSHRRVEDYHLEKLNSPWEKAWDFLRKNKECSLTALYWPPLHKTACTHQISKNFIDFFIDGRDSQKIPDIWVLLKLKMENKTKQNTNQKVIRGNDLGKN